MQYALCIYEAVTQKRNHSEQCTYFSPPLNVGDLEALINFSDGGKVKKKKNNQKPFLLFPSLLRLAQRDSEVQTNQNSSSFILKSSTCCVKGKKTAEYTCPLGDNHHREINVLLCSSIGNIRVRSDCDNKILNHSRLSSFCFQANFGCCDANVKLKIIIIITLAVKFGHLKANVDLKICQ